MVVAIEPLPGTEPTTSSVSWTCDDVQKLLKKYGAADGSLKKPNAIPRTYFQPQHDTSVALNSVCAPLCRKDSVAQDQSAWLDHSGVNSLLRVGIGEHIPPESVATPYGLGTVQSLGDSVTVNMNWCTAHLAPSCVQRSRIEVLEETLLSLNSTLGVYVDALPPLTGCERPGATRTSSFFAVSRPRPGRPLSRRGSGVSRDASPATPGTGRHSKENVPRDFTVLDAARKIKDMAGCGFLTQDSPSNRRSLSNGFEPKIVGTPRKNTESPRISKEMADCTVAPPSIPTNVEEAVSRMSHVRTLMSWLEEAARQPVLEHHEELPEIAVLLSGIVRSRTELAQLRHLDSDPQLHAERLVADAVRIHLGLLERHKPRPARPRQDHWGPSCHKWRAVLQKLIATGETYDGDSGHTSGHGTPSCPPDGKLIWPGASRVDVEESIEACTSSFDTPSLQPRMIPQIVGTRRVLRSPSPSIRVRGRITRRVYHPVSSRIRVRSVGPTSSLPPRIIHVSNPVPANPVPAPAQQVSTLPASNLERPRVVRASTPVVRYRRSSQTTSETLLPSSPPPLPCRSWQEDRRSCLLGGTGSVGLDVY
mmetsp:Transcript_10716/g.29810  ORF Transcript_10716/g.29810 Transcript_10716/m.29810 type:complete len:591 (-) Transcript_10716:76-1848(-)